VSFVVATEIRRVPREQDRSRDPGKGGQGAAPGDPVPLRVLAVRAKAVDEDQGKDHQHVEGRPARQHDDRSADALEAQIVHYRWQPTFLFTFGLSLWSA